MCAGCRALEPFAEPRGLLDYLRGRGGTQSAKNNVLHALLVCREKDAEVASSLLTLALWPGLDHVCWRLRRAFCGDADALADELIGAFGDVVSGSDPARVNSVAATLIRNAERDAKRELAEQRTLASQVDPESETRLAGLADPAEICVLERIDDTGAWLRAMIEQDFGADARMVYDVAVNEETQRDAARRLGLPYHTVRKRHERAVDRIRRARPDYLAPRIPMRAPDWRITGGDAGPAGIPPDDANGAQRASHQASAEAAPAIGDARKSADRRRVPGRRCAGGNKRANEGRSPPRR